MVCCMKYFQVEQCVHEAYNRGFLLSTYSASRASAARVCSLPHGSVWDREIVLLEVLASVAHITAVRKPKLQDTLHLPVRHIPPTRERKSKQFSFTKVRCPKQNQEPAPPRRDMKTRNPSLAIASELGKAGINCAAICWCRNSDPTRRASPTVLADCTYPILLSLYTSACGNERGTRQKKKTVSTIKHKTGATEIVPFFHRLSDNVGAAASRKQQHQQHQALCGSGAPPPSGTGTGGSAGGGGGEGGSGANVPAEANDRVRLDAERQILLTMLLAQMCSEHDATPRTFVEQVGVSCTLQSRVGGAEGQHTAGDRRGSIPQR